MKNALKAAAVIGALAVPAESDALLMDMGPMGPICVVSTADKTGVWDCRQELRPSHQSTPEGVLLSTRILIGECEGVAVENGATADAKKPNRVSTHASGAGTAACLPEAVAEVNRELKAHAISCGVVAAAAPTEGDATRFEVSASCGKKDK